MSFHQNELMIKANESRRPLTSDVIFFVFERSKRFLDVNCLAHRAVYCFISATSDERTYLATGL